MPTLQSQQFTVNGTFVVPTGVSCIWLTQVGAGGGGGQSVASIGAGAAGGCSGESCYSYAVHVTPGASIPILMGVGGTSASGANQGTAGLETSFGSVSCQGGQGGHSANQSQASLISGKGGGVNGGYIGSQPNEVLAVSGTAESASFFGGSTGSGITQVGGLRGANVAEYAGGAGDSGSGGSASPYGVGGLGGRFWVTPNAPSYSDGNPPPTSAKGAGGGGAGVKIGSNAPVGGAGANGYCLVQWFG